MIGAHEILSDFQITKRLRYRPRKIAFSYLRESAMKPTGEYIGR
jgi:hypothetical protein